MKTTENQKTQKPLPSEKQHLALCYAVIDLGTQTGVYKGAPTSARKIAMTWEIPGERATFKPELGPQPFVVTSEYTFSIGATSNYRKMLDSWLGKKVTEEMKELDSEMILRFLKRPGMIQIEHNKSDKDGLFYANIANKGISIFKRPAEVPFPKETENEAYFFDLDNFSWDTFDKIPKFLQNKIEKSPEFKAASSMNPRTGAAPAQSNGVVTEENAFEEDEPF